ncbi:MAG: hypothetical protein IMZ62_05715 [Chloroflexi bacterium]|nr:hypothetical protein [Chloroflexota bacterium]
MTLHLGNRPTVELVYEYIVWYKGLHDGNSPTYREIMDGVHLGSTSVVSYFLEQLKQKGLIRRPEPRIGVRYSATIEVIGGRWTKEPSHG